jgi:hypothetical protein
MEKICSKCKKAKNIKYFNNNKLGKFGVHHYCKICLRENKNKSYNYLKSKTINLKYKYNITPEDILIMYYNQNCCCFICCKQYDFDMVSKLKGLYVDHCHETGKIRGLLCSNCNSALGKFKDNIESLKNAIVYLSK